MKLFENIASQERCLRGVEDENKALNDSFINNDREDTFSDLETMLDTYCHPNASLEGEGWDNFKRGIIKVKEGSSKFFHGLVKAGKATAKTAKMIGGRISDFVSTLKNSVKDKVVTEKYIHEQFDAVNKAIQESTNVRCYVEDVPSYEDLISRLNGIINSANFIKQLSTKDDTADTHVIMEQLVVKSKGVVSVKKPNEGSSFTNMEWKAPDLQSFDIKGSKYGDPKALNTLKNLILHCKYEATDDLITAGNTIDKRAKQKAEDMEDHNYGGYSADVDSDSREAGNYALVYTVGKVVKQFYKEAIQKELNMIMTVYCKRMRRFIDK